MWEGDYTPDPKAPWVKMFAWRPVKVHSKWVWLKTVYRTYEYNHEHGIRYVPKYGTILDVLSE